MKKQLMIIRVHLHVFLSRFSYRHARRCGLVGIGAATTFNSKGKPGLPLAAAIEIGRIRSLC